LEITLLLPHFYLLHFLFYFIHCYHQLVAEIIQALHPPKMALHRVQRVLNLQLAMHHQGHQPFLLGHQAISHSQNQSFLHLHLHLFLLFLQPNCQLLPFLDYYQVHHLHNIMKPWPLQYQLSVLLDQIILPLMVFLLQ